LEGEEAGIFKASAGGGGGGKWEEEEGLGGVRGREWRERERERERERGIGVSEEVSSPSIERWCRSRRALVQEQKGASIAVKSPSIGAKEP